MKGRRVILPRQPQTVQAVASHYDALDSFYREIWGEHVHHGYWETGRESVTEAAVALVKLLAQRLRLEPGQRVCDIGCGYGAMAHYLAQQHGLDVTGVTVSPVQARRALERNVERGHLLIELQDWMSNSFPAGNFDRVYAVESSEHMPDKQRFFNEAHRTLKPGGLFGICAWLACDDPRPWQVRHLLEPICREGRLPGMGDEADYRRFAEQAGFRLVEVEDLSKKVRRTWGICVRRVLGKLVTQRRYIRFLLDGMATDRIFAVTLVRILIAYRTRTMRYCLMVFQRD
jgi:tocopherol O-methyltransferase